VQTIRRPRATKRPQIIKLCTLQASGTQFLEVYAQLIEIIAERAAREVRDGRSLTIGGAIAWVRTNLGAFLPEDFADWRLRIFISTAARYGVFKDYDLELRRGVGFASRRTPDAEKVKVG
jgi:hypothetical protein